MKILDFRSHQGNALNGEDFDSTKTYHGSILFRSPRVLLSRETCYGRTETTEAQAICFASDGKVFLAIGTFYESAGGNSHTAWDNRWEVAEVIKGNLVECLKALAPSR